MQSFNLNVDFAPTFVNLASTTFTVGQPGSFLVAASGFPAPTLTVTGGLPAGVTVVSNPDGTATLEGMPALGTGGTYSLGVTANNSAGTASERFTLTVDEDAVFTSLSNYTDLVDNPVDISPTATGFPKPTFIGYTGELPSYISFDPTQDLFSGVPQATTPSGQPDLIHLVIDNADGTTATQTVEISVVPEPTFTSASSATFPLGEPGTFAVKTNSVITPALFESGFLPPGVTFVDNGNGTGTLSGTTSYAGSYSIDLEAAVGSSTVVSPFTLNVVGQSPQVTSGTMPRSTRHTRVHSR